jgi:hypothetical protein
VTARVQAEILDIRMPSKDMSSRLLKWFGQHQQHLRVARCSAGDKLLRFHSVKIRVSSTALSKSHRMGLPDPAGREMRPRNLPEASLVAMNPPE